MLHMLHLAGAGVEKQIDFAQFELCMLHLVVDPIDLHHLAGAQEALVALDLHHIELLALDYLALELLERELLRGPGPRSSLGSLEEAPYSLLVAKAAAFQCVSCQLSLWGGVPMSHKRNPKEKPRNAVGKHHTLDTNFGI